MDWIAQHLQLIIAIAGGVAWWLNKNREKTGEAPPPRAEKTFDDPELAERTRRIREEIQRKIDQRARGYAHEQPTVPRSEPVSPPPLVRQVAPSRPETARAIRAAASHQEAQRTAEILEQQAALMEQVRLANEMKAATQRRTQFETEVASKEEVAMSAVRSALGEDLRDPAALRRAFILREVLGPPLALRS